MRGLIITVVATLLTVFVAAPGAKAQQMVEGTVASTKLTACDPKPGGCEGSLVLEPRGASSARVTIRVVKGTQIAEGSKHLLLPATKGRQAVITYVEDKGEKVAKSIEVKAPKP